MKNLFYFFWLAFIFASCTHDAKPNFIYLDKLSGVINYSEYSLYREVLLVDNPPSNNDSLIQLVDNYLLQNGKNMCDLDSNVGAYSIKFYKKTRNTSYFIHKAEDPGGFSSYLISDYPEDELCFYYFKRSEQNPKVWVMRYDGRTVDTVAICE